MSAKTVVRWLDRPMTVSRWLLPAGLLYGAAFVFGSPWPGIVGGACLLADLRVSQRRGVTK